MKKLLVILGLAILASCGQLDSDTSDTINKDIVEFIESIEEVEINTDITSYFNDFPKDSIKIVVEQYTQERTFKPSDCLPLTFLPVLDNKIPQTQSESTGAKPVGKLKVNDSSFFLVVVQQDDYGPIYYGMIYNSGENMIKESEQIAEIWGDAGDSQVTYSVVSLTKESVKINKYIETCHLDLELEEDDPAADEIECSDSTATIELKIN